MGHLEGRGFASDEEVNQFATLYLNTHGRDIFQDGIFKLIPASNMVTDMDYVEIIVETMLKKKLSACTICWLNWLYEIKRTRITVDTVTSLLIDPCTLK